MSFDFTAVKVGSYYENKSYIIPSISNMASLHTVLNSKIGFTAKTLVIQYTEDQYGKGAQPRIVSSDGEDENLIIPITDISQTLADEIEIARVEIEIEINKQR